MTIQLTDSKAVTSFDNLFTDLEGANLVAISNEEMSEVDGGLAPLIIAGLIVGGVFLAGVAAGYIYERCK